MPQSAQRATGRGVFYGLFAYLLWGTAPLYWQLLKPATATEILAHRMTWSLIFLAILNLVRKSWKDILEVLRNPRLLRLLTLASILITVNWGLYIWSVVNDKVIDASLGYFINPLINVAFGIVIFREKLRRIQWAAVVIAGAGVLWLTIAAGRLPWIGITLGLTFGAYGMVKKLANVDGVESLTVETILLLPFSASYLIFLELTQQAAFGHSGFGQAFWAMFAGVFTAVPLLAFGAAAVRIPYSTMGILQYFSPTTQFLIGFFVLGETMTNARWIGYSIIWFGLLIFSIDAIKSRKNFAVSEE